jgi:hypothetical protein
MSVLDDQLKRLEADLAGRERWARSLQRHIAEFQDELAAHEAIIALGRDPSTLRVIQELYDQPGLGRRSPEILGPSSPNEGLAFPSMRRRPS